MQVYIHHASFVYTTICFLHQEAKRWLGPPKASAGSFPLCISNKILMGLRFIFGLSAAQIKALPIRAFFKLAISMNSSGVNKWHWHWQFLKQLKTVKIYVCALANRLTGSSNLCFGNHISMNNNDKNWLAWRLHLFNLQQEFTLFA